MDDERKSEAAELTAEALTDEVLDKTSGGSGGIGFYMTVGYCNGSDLPLRPEPVWDQYHELARLYPGYQVFTYGACTNGTGLNGSPCTYRYVCYKGMWGWADSAYLH
ncbi:MAG: hypothetical protein E7422_06415 [Ruminococcaceae bacterium]|jgi:hypothetical protein|nr:hypothetical protein [Oscillospiraceae bacterium]